MRIDLKQQDSGGLQFDVIAETDYEQVTLEQFRKQVEAEKPVVEFKNLPAKPLGPVAFRLGTVKKR